MPLFDSASGLQIMGGTFIDNAGDININTTQLQLPGQDCDPLQALEFVATQGPSRQLLGVERNSQQAGAARRVPYDISHRPQILSSSHHHVPDDGSWSTSAASISSLSNPPSFPFSHPEYNFDFSSFFESPSTTNGNFPSAPDSTVGYPELFQDSVNSTALEYPLTHPVPMSGTHEYYGQVLSSDNEPIFEPTSTALVLNSEPFAEIFSEQTQPRIAPSFHPSNTTADASFDFSLNSNFLAGSFGEPVVDDIGSNAFSVATRNHLPWNDPPFQLKTNIHGGTFIGGNLNHTEHHGEAGLHILHRAIAGDAFHNSAERFPQPKCHPETRTKILENLWNWTRGNYSFSNDLGFKSETASKITWLYSPAGAGKSAIAQSLCQKLETEGCFGGAFFFKRGDSSRGNGNKLFSTLAYQLCRCRPELKRAICQVVEDDPSITDYSLSIQLQQLIIEPRQQNLHGHTLTIIIDGLDECEGHNIQQEILRSIGRVIHDKSLPLRFLIASRPEPHIREIFMDTLNKHHYPLNVDQSFEDVRKYLLDEFARIHREHHATMAMIPEPWPSPEIIHNLVWKSSGYFIYASTIIKFIDDKNFRPTERLAVITGMAEPRFGVPFAALDQLYTQVLAQVPDQPQLLEILTVITTELSYKPLSAISIEQLLELEPGEVQLVLRGLHSVINLPEDDNDGISTHHASFGDFLRDPTRAGIFYVGGCQHRTDLSRHILKALSYKYDDPSLNRRGHVSWYFDLLAFQCLASCEPSLDLITLLRSFNPDFLFERPQRNGLISIVLNWLKKSQPQPKDLIQLWEDYRFMNDCEQRWDEGGELEVTGADRDHCSQILSQASPSLIRIIQAIRLIPTNVYATHLLKIHFLLDFSWDELRTTICSLRLLVGEEGEGLLIKLFHVLLDPTLFPVPFDLIMWDLACGSLHVMQQILRGELDKSIL
ncbi:hypothetical protein B0H13DRAFT_796377 [Mycena leptocephala]|nr:hypothetical protein B0H13DRAFT_796377 [Mycena leptocephala]